MKLENLRQKHAHTVKKRDREQTKAKREYSIFFSIRSHLPILLICLLKESSLFLETGEEKKTFQVHFGQFQFGGQQKRNLAILSLLSVSCFRL